MDFEKDVISDLNEVVKEISEELLGNFYAEKLTRGFEIAIVGAPNVGKSTLLNYLVGDSVSIVSEIPGTTRDVIESRVNIGGYLVSFFDCAGIRESIDPIEKIGVERAEKRANLSDLRIFLIDSPKMRDFKSIDRNTNDIICISKIDTKTNFKGYQGISGKTGEGVDDLIKLITDRLNEYSEKSGFSCNIRHRNAMEKAVGFMKSANTNLLYREGKLEFVAEDIRQALLCLEELLGRIDIEEVYGEIFSRFCIGK